MPKFIVVVKDEPHEIEADSMQIDGNGHARFVTEGETIAIYRDYQSATPA